MRIAKVFATFSVVIIGVLFIGHDHRRGIVHWRSCRTKRSKLGLSVDLYALRKPTLLLDSLARVKNTTLMEAVKHISGDSGAVGELHVLSPKKPALLTARHDRHGPGMVHTTKKRHTVIVIDESRIGGSCLILCIENTPPST